MNKGLTGLEQYEGWIINDWIFIFGWTNHAKLQNSSIMKHIQIQL